MKKRTMLIGLSFSLIAFWASVAYAEDPFQKGATEWGFSVGFGDNFHIEGDVKEDIQFYFLTPSWGKVLRIWDRFGSSEFLIEGFLSYARQESENRYASGITSLLVHSFKPLGKTVFFLELGVGILYTNLNPKNFGSSFNFTPQGGIGVRYKIGPGRFLKFSYRFHHISNAGIDEDNRGINSHFFALGISFF
ncbi:MAG: acyloxyacyl hydrolase [Deltaproteobacteria bacterium]|nr:MAG: acyloxyacyl hydrolase [Deltaproteobacteria bacterium]